MKRTHKYLLRPDAHQEEALDFLLRQSRLVYNAALEQRITAYRETGKGVKYVEQWTHFRDLRRGEPDTLGKLNASSMQHMLRRLDKSFRAFFRRSEAGEKPGFPRFKGCNRFKSFEYTYGDGCKLRRDEHGRMKFYVQNVGEIRLCYHRPIPRGARNKHAVIKHTNGRWYACLMLELPDTQPVHPHPEKAVGVDIGLYHLLALSNDQIVDNPHWLRESLAMVRVLQRKAARRKRGSRRQRKAYAQIGRLHEHIANQRRDYLHRVTRILVNEYGFIAVENLSLAFMNRNKHLALSSHDTGLGEFRQLLQYKAEDAGAEVVAVSPAFTSQACSSCGEIVEKPLSTRVHSCPNCGLKIDRDVNAAINILNLAKQQAARTGRSGRNVGGRAVRVLRSCRLQAAENVTMMFHRQTNLNSMRQGSGEHSRAWGRKQVA